MAAVLGHAIDFSPSEDATSSLQSLPAQRAVFLVRGETGSEPYVAKTADLRHRLESLLGSSAAGKRLSLRSRCKVIEYSLTGSDFESRLLLYQTVRAEFPKDYRDRLRLRFAPLIKLNLENPFPRAYITRRVGRLRSLSRYYGPFPSRAAAERFLNAVLDLFKIRRCDFELDPDPAYPGCMYSEMKMCLAPCFKGCTDEQYRSEVEHVREFLESRGESLVREIEAQREHASQNLEFEAAAAQHERLQKIRSLTGATMLPEAVRPLDHLDALIVQCSAQPDAVAIFRMQHGIIQAPLQFEAGQFKSSGAVNTEKSAPRSMESRIGELLASAPTRPPHSAAELNEHLALFKRWYYRSRRDGEIFFAGKKDELPLRRIVRGIGRILQGEKPETGENDEALRAYWLARTREPEKPE